jgi:hypothetical protein
MINRISDFIKDDKNKAPIIVLLIGAALALLSFVLLPGTIGTQVSSGTLYNMMSRNTVISAEFILTLCALFMYVRHGYVRRLLVLASFGDVLALLILILNLICRR